MTVALTVIAALAGGFVFEQLHLPAGSFLGAVLGVAVVNLAAAEGAAAIPSWARFAAFVALGWAVGQSVSREVLGELGRALPAVVATIVVLIVAGGLLAWVLVRFGALDPHTAYLATSPGALAQMVALADDTEADVLLVVTVHTLRVIAVVLVAPLVVRLL